QATTTDRNAYHTEAVEIPGPAQQYEQPTLLRPPELAGQPVASISSPRMPGRDSDPAQPISSSSPQKSPRPSDAYPLHGSKTSRLDPSSNFLDPGRSFAVQQHWDSAAPAHMSNGLAAVSDRPENNLSTVHPVVSSTNDTFAALDADRAASPATWIHAGIHRAEAGY